MLPTSMLIWDWSKFRFFALFFYLLMKCSPYGCSLQLLTCPSENKNCLSKHTQGCVLSPFLYSHTPMTAGPPQTLTSLWNLQMTPQWWAWCPIGTIEIIINIKKDKRASCRLLHGNSRGHTHTAFHINAGPRGWKHLNTCVSTSSLVLTRLSAGLKRSHVYFLVWAGRFSEV